MIPKIKRVTNITVGDFFTENEKALQLKIIGEDIGFTRKISEPSVNRPGLALAGFFSYFPYKRIQVLGNSEQSYLQGLKEDVLESRFSQLCSWEIPCIMMARGHRIHRELVEIANQGGISIFQSSMVTMKFINAATIKLEWAFAPSTTVHGCLVDVQGIGVLIKGKSGTGKSESVLGLLQRGASLVADDAVKFKLIEEREVVGTAPDLTRNMIEIRGLGLLNVAALFGVGAVRLSKRLDLIVNLVHVQDADQLERVGMESATEDVMGIPISKVDIPVAPGRDVAGLIEIAAMNYKLRSFGYNSAIEFDQRLLKKIADEQLG
jgi:HPr kinase/phosphorylase